MLRSPSSGDDPGLTRYMSPFARGKTTSSIGRWQICRRCSRLRIVIHADVQTTPFTSPDFWTADIEGFVQLAACQTAGEGMFSSKSQGKSGRGLDSETLEHSKSHNGDTKKTMVALVQGTGGNRDTEAQSRAYIVFRPSKEGIWSVHLDSRQSSLIAGWENRDV